jgi:hypothetical protein
MSEITFLVPVKLGRPVGDLYYTVLRSRASRECVEPAEHALPQSGNFPLGGWNVTLAANSSTVVTKSGRSPGVVNSGMDGAAVGAPWDHNIDLRPGSMISYQFGDQIWTQQVESVTYSTQLYVAAPRLSRRARIIRWFTPRRRRRPLPLPSGGMPVVTLTTGDPIWGNV